jgi:subtilisin-like proprotein convertase family protein
VLRLYPAFAVLAFAAPAALAQTHASSDTPLAIPDNAPAGVVSTLVVPAGAPIIADLDVRLDVSHLWMGDVRLVLAKGATTSALMDRPRHPVRPDGCSGYDVHAFADDEGDLGTLEDLCNGSVSSIPAFIDDGHYVPNTPLSAFDGQSAAGTWTLTASDLALGEAGTLTSWALIVTAPPVAAEPGALPGGYTFARTGLHPARTATQLTVSVAEAQPVRIALYDALGREVRVVFDGELAAGQTAFLSTDVSGLAPGHYLARARGGVFAAAVSVVVAR